MRELIFKADKCPLTCVLAPFQNMHGTATLDLLEMTANLWIFLKCPQIENVSSYEKGKEDTLHPELLLSTCHLQYVR